MSLFKPLVSKYGHPWCYVEALAYPFNLLGHVISEHHRTLDELTVKFTHNKLIFSEGFFPDGWGDTAVPSMLWDFIDQQRSNVGSFYPREIDVQTDGQAWYMKREGAVVQNCRFRTPLENSERWLPKESGEAYFQLVVPTSWLGDSSQSLIEQEESLQHPRDKKKARAATKGKERRNRDMHTVALQQELMAGKSNSHKVPLSAERKLAIILPGTGEFGYTRRLNCLALPLARRGVASIILEGPFYGKRKPSNQKGSKLRRVSDLPILGRATIEEASSLVRWCREILGVKKLALSGCSMGGLHSAMTASFVPYDVGVASWLGPPSAVPVFTRGLMSKFCNWDQLYKDAQSWNLESALASLNAHPDDSLSLRALLSEKQEQPIEEQTQSAINAAKRHMAAFLALTDITNFPPPARPDSAVFAVGDSDAYIGDTQSYWEKLLAEWKGAEVRQINGGHVSALIFQNKAFQDIIVEVLGRV